MTWIVNDKEFQTVMALPDGQRYSYFIKRVADQAAIWSVRSTDGWVLGADDNGNEYMPVWPHPRFAKACTSDEWAGEPESIEVHEWIRKWIPGLMNDNRKIFVFPTPGGKGVAVDPQRVKKDLEEELSRIE
jgi:hypothetical protein